MTQHSAVSVGLVSLCLLSGCAVIPTPEFERDVPDTWQHENARNVDAEWPAQEQDWWNSFASKELSDIIRHVETRNLDLQNSVRTLQNAQEIARIVEARVDAGVVPAIDALQQQIAVQQQVSTIAALKQEEFAALSALAVLMVKPVNAFEVGAKTLQHLVTPQVVPGIPSELLHRRPDLVRAEAALRIARADLEAARRALLPSISLTAAVNRSSESLVELVSGGGLGISITSGLVQRIFDTGHRNRRLRRQQLTYESLIADYRQAIIRAFSDVEVALGNISLLESLGETALEDLARATESLRIAEVRYREGVDDYQSVLYAQNLLYSTRDSVLGNKLAHLNAIIRVYQSIGGGWRSDYPAN